MTRTPWIHRTFHFGIPPGWMPNILERLLSTELRIKHLTQNLSEEDAKISFKNKWSIKEHIGHLTDLEELHTGRINDFVLRKPKLRAADMSNAKTEKANHNEKSLSVLIEDFQEARGKFITHLTHLDDDTQQFAALHPRLKLEMRPVDLAFFTAEHDDHHLASIRELLTFI